MNNTQKRTHQAYRNAIATFKPRAASIAPDAAAVFERLEATVAEIETHFERQHRATRVRGVTSARHQLQRLREQQMLPLARLARPLFAGEPRIVSALRVPHKRARSETILAASMQMTKVLRPHGLLLIASGIDPSRVDQLDVEATRLTHLFARAHAATADRAAPTRRLPALFASAREDARILDALVAATGDKTLVRAWRTTRRIGKRRGRPRRKNSNAEASKTMTTSSPDGVAASRALESLDLMDLHESV